MSLISTNPDQVVVVGAGPAGLAAACVLTSRRVPVCVIERADVVGGKVESYREQGRSIEHGVHGWWMNYLNFNQLLENAGVDLNEALKEADGSNVARSSGFVYHLHTFRSDIPSPLFLFLQMLRSPFLNWTDIINLFTFAVHLLAFDHEVDYEKYDGISFQQLMNDLDVPQRIQYFMLRPFILSFDFAAPDRVSAACGLSGPQFYVLRDQRSLRTRWSRGLPADTMFGPLVDYLRRNGSDVALRSPARSVVIEDGAVTGVSYETPNPSGGPEQVIATVLATTIPDNRYIQAGSGKNECWISHQNGHYYALRALCPHQGCNVDWNDNERLFQCPCHGSRFDPSGQLVQGPATASLAKLSTVVQGENVQVLGDLNATMIAPAKDVILAVDTHAAQQLLNSSPGVDRRLVNDVQHLDTNPVVVIRLWFESSAVIPRELESAITPDAKFIDNFFFLNDWSSKYDVEGNIVEVQSYRVDQWIDRSDNEILDVVFEDIAPFCPGLSRAKVSWHEIQRHRALFTRYKPGDVCFRPRAETTVKGLFLAGDWTRADWSVWMMERAVVSGVRAANAVLSRRGLSEVPILRLPDEGVLLRMSRAMCRTIRDYFWKGYPPRPLNSGIRGGAGSR